MSRKKEIVVLGGGFAGIEFCQKLRHPDAHITLIDRQNHHLFQPLLYQVATAGLSAPEIAQPIRAILTERDDVSVFLGDIKSIDLEKREVRTRLQNFSYDYLVIALGARTSYFGHDEWEEFAPGLKSLDDATRIRRDVLLAFERAESSSDPEEIRRYMTVVVVGGGPTGVELAGAFAELSRRVFKGDFRHVDPTTARVVLVEAAPRVLGMFPEKLSAAAQRQLEALGVEVRLNSPVEDVGEGYLVVAGERIEAENIIWAAGVQANPLTKELGVELDRAGRIVVGSDLSVPGHPEVLALGDIAHIVDKKGIHVPGVAPAAIQTAQHAAKIVKAELRAGKEKSERPAYQYWDKGTMATIGRSAAVAMTPGGRFQFTGFIAWMMWLFIHLLFLVGMRNKIAVLLQWFYSYIHYKRGARIITGLNQIRSRRKRYVEKYQ